MKGRNRNSSCWCGSGKKYKKCHLDRDAQPKENPWAAVDQNRKAFTQKKCCADGVGLGPCEGGVIKAHTVSRGPNLARIAENGHVLHYTASIPEMNKNGGKLSIKKIGIKDASVFHGFCRKHDRELFSCIENEPFTGRPDQCLAVAYRTMSRELYGKDAGAHLRETLRGADKGLQLFEQFMFQKVLDVMNLGNEAARRELKATHDTLRAALVSDQPDVISSLILEFAAPLPFMFAGAWSPFSDFYGSELQVGYADELLEQVMVSSFAGDTHAMICISWRDIDGAPGKVIADQIRALPADQQASACLQLAAKHMENVFYNPNWFEGLDDSPKKQLQLLAASGMDFAASVPSEPIRLDVDFQLATASKSFQI
ncbi:MULTISPECIES: SEC-C domain-containing protein [unclassified Phaeobacter]|uniref:SEC-C domain-containing protein n=1 Tax=unclassified Phaeobacter TaxID=2621772 RepID=UPI003A8BBE54